MVTAVVYDQYDDDVPKPRHGHRIMCKDNYIYCMGGFNRPGILKELWKFNRHTHEWIEIAATTNMPKELVSNAILFEGQMLMIFGCPEWAAPIGESYSNELLVCYPNLTPLEFQRVDTRGKKPSSTDEPNMIIHNNDLYTIGAPFCHVHKLDLKTLKWESVYEYETNGDYPQGMYENIAYDGHFIYILGGGTENELIDFIELPSFDLNKRSWKSIKTQPDETTHDRYPYPRCYHSCIQYNEDDELYVVIAGGDSDIYNRHYTNHHYDDIWRLSLKSYKWSMIRTATLPKQIYSHDATISDDGCMYIFGGIMVYEDSEEKVNDLYKIWLKIPKLSVMCWEAVLHYFPNLKTFSRADLLQLGIPLKYVSALHPLKMIL